jgi:hypothetical protein
MLATILAIALSAGAADPTPDAAIAEPDPKTMSQKEIRAFNARLTRTHPHYIRCVRSAAIGSLVARNYSCRTNEQWARADRVGNDEARIIGDQMASKFQNSN